MRKRDYQIRRATAIDQFGELIDRTNDRDRFAARMHDESPSPTGDIDEADNRNARKLSLA